MSRRWKAPGSYREEVQRSLELLDQVLSEFDEVDMDTPDIGLPISSAEESEAHEIKRTADAHPLKPSETGGTYTKKPAPWKMEAERLLNIETSKTCRPPLIRHSTSDPGTSINSHCSSPDSAAASDGPDIIGRNSIGPHTTEGGISVSSSASSRQSRPSEGDQSEDDGYMSMNGGRSLPRAHDDQQGDPFGHPSASVGLPAHIVREEEESDKLIENDERIRQTGEATATATATATAAASPETDTIRRSRPPPSPAEAERLIASLLPRVSPRHSEGRHSNPETNEPATANTSVTPNHASSDALDVHRASTPTATQATQTQSTSPNQAWWIPCETVPEKTSSNSRRIIGVKKSASVSAEPSFSARHCRLDSRGNNSLCNCSNHHSHPQRPAHWPSTSSPCCIRGNDAAAFSTAMPEWPDFHLKRTVIEEWPSRHHHSQSLPHHAKRIEQGFQPVIRDRLERNVNIYLPNPPSPTPDYDCDLPVGKCSDDEDVSDDSLQGTPITPRGSSSNNKGAEPAEAVFLDRCSDNESLFSEDSLESEPSSLHCTWGSLSGAGDQRFGVTETDEVIKETGQQSSSSSLSVPHSAADMDDLHTRWSWQSTLEREATAREDILQGDLAKSTVDDVQTEDSLSEPRDQLPETIPLPPVQLLATPTVHKPRESTDFSSIHQLLANGLLEGLDEPPPSFKPPPPPRKSPGSVISSCSSLSRHSSATDSEDNLSLTRRENLSPLLEASPPVQRQSLRRTHGMSPVVYPESDIAFRIKPTPTPPKVQPRLGIRMGVRAMGSPAPRYGGDPFIITPAHVRPFPIQHRYSTEALDKLGFQCTSFGTSTSMCDHDVPQKPATLPTGLTPNFHHRSSARETLRRVTSLLIRRGSSKEGKKDANTTIKSADGSTSSNSKPKRSFFKSLWRRSRQYSLEPR